MPIHVTVKYNDKLQIISVRIKKIIGDAVISKLNTTKASGSYGDQDDYDYSDEWKEREQEDKE